MMEKRYTVEDSVAGKRKPAIRVENRERGEYMWRSCKDEAICFGPAADKLYAYEELGYSPEGLKLMIAELEYLRKERFAKPVSEIEKKKFVIFPTANTTKEKEKTMNKNFTKADLKVGYVVKHRNGALAMVMPGRKGNLIVIDMKANYTEVEHFRENLTTAYSPLDIVEVYGYSCYNYTSMLISTSDRELLWKREEAKKMTVSEIEEALGYKVEVVADGTPEKLSTGVVWTPMGEKVLRERGSYGK